jgi:Na+/H+ antiporter NhaD/arsenite permease-like protein
MRARKQAGLVVLLFLVLFVLASPAEANGSEDEVRLTIVGRAVDSQNTGVGEAEVRVMLHGAQQTLWVGGKEAEVVHTNEDGSYVIELTLPRSLVGSETLTVEASKPTYRTTSRTLAPQEIAHIADRCYAGSLDIVLPHVLNPAFFIATLTFVGVFVLIAFQVMHDTAAAFVGATVMMGVSYLLGTFDADFWILGFERAIEFVDFDVIFLIMSLMIVVSIIGRTGMFQWLALAAYRAARGSAWRLAVILMLATALLSAFLNNVTIILLMAPITIEIAMVLGINPVALILPEALVSNVGGIATLIGDPPNTVIGSYAGLGFNQFLIHMTPIAIVGTLALIVVVYLIYRRDYAAVRREPSQALMARLEQDARITDPVTLRRSLVVVSVMLVLFFTGELFQMPPSVVGLIGATALLVWVRPDVEEMLGEVDWTTLMFFISLFIMVGGVQEVGLIRWITDVIADVAGADLGLASQVIIWLSAAASAIVNNIPFTTAVLPIAAFLTQTVPGAGNQVLYWGLSLGANLGGNATYIGSAPNVVAVGILERAGYRVSFVDWLKVGIPVALATVLASTVWLWVRYFWLKF